MVNQWLLVSLYKFLGIMLILCFLGIINYCFSYGPISEAVASMYWLFSLKNQHIPCRKKNFMYPLSTGVAITECDMANTRNLRWFLVDTWKNLFQISLNELQPSPKKIKKMNCNHLRSMTTKYTFAICDSCRGCFHDSTL